MAELDPSAAYSEEGEGFKIVKTVIGSKFKILRDRSNGMWTIEVDSGTVPSPLRGRYTNHTNALTDIKNYIDGHAQRKIEYKKVREAAA